jgi:hypothetical protein
MATSNVTSSRKPRPSKMIQVHFATNRNPTGNKKHPFGSDFRIGPVGSLYVTGTINVYRRSPSRRPNWSRI